MRRGRTTIQDVAQQAGVSVATVSKVINARYGVAAATAAKVQAVIEELGYESSLVARSLRSHRTGVIGILVAELEPFTAELLKGAGRAVEGSGYELMVYAAGGPGIERVGWERRNLSRLGGTLIDGAILVAPTVVTPDDTIPLVAVDPHRGRSGLPMVNSDNRAGGRAATEHLLALGHRRIGFLAGRPDLESAEQREAGYRDALAAHGIPVDPALIEVGGYEQERAERAARALLTLPDRPTAVFAANDRSAIETLEIARTLGISVPGELSVVGFDNIPESVMCHPPLTTVDQFIQHMGFDAVELLLRMLAGKTPEQTHLTRPTTLVVRQSSGTAPGRRAPRPAKVAAARSRTTATVARAARA
ncbi:LacI family transcriptional regulator [Motilibacter peucedani]|uniref:LacI family transcriptional regulator n=1 Tax=Motilibacter peucedani TaxID=598650 RepID=A0A420XT37_9ACTN|nr:LacI family DNA-binding transcriptional regulator [Motilibacter peucedani]RKS80005.1 LacI family transcriptional regulator [Motilibacter peucedani]